jgi:hypothetical protein
MDLVYRHGGSTSFKRDSRLAECWRDLHVVGQTVTIAPEWYPIGGRVYLGLDPGLRRCASQPSRHGAVAGRRQRPDANLAHRVLRDFWRHSHSGAAHLRCAGLRRAC